MGEPVRLMFDLANDDDLDRRHLHPPSGAQRLLVASDRRATGSSWPEAEVVAQTRSGKQALNVKPGIEGALVCQPVDRGSRRRGRRRIGKLLVFPVWRNCPR